MLLRPESCSDFYKVDHRPQYPDDTKYIYSNLTGRSAEYAPGLPGLFEKKMINFGIQGFSKEYLIDAWRDNFFKLPLHTVLMRFKRRMDNALGPNSVQTEHIADLHRLGYLPLRIKALPEGAKVPVKVPFLTIVNTLPDFFWLTNAIETVMSAFMWKQITNATTAYKYRLLYEKYAEATGGSKEFIAWQGHDFSFRGMSGPEDAARCGAAHLLSFNGTDTIPAIDYLEDYYGGLYTFVGGSVPATEHSVTSIGSQEHEDETLLRIITKIYPSGVVSIVSDTWDFWRVITEFAPKYKEQILARKPNGLGLAKVVFRPDSGDPVKIICGDPNAPEDSPEYLGAVRLLWNIFGGTINSKGYRTLNQRVGLIYGDSITLQRAKDILQGLQDLGFASDNIVTGIGSYTYQHVTRDSYGMAVKATWGVVGTQDREIFKNPKTDSGKRSAKGLLLVTKDNDGNYVLRDQVSPLEEMTGELTTVFENGGLFRETSLAEIRQLLLNG